MTTLQQTLLTTLADHDVSDITTATKLLDQVEASLGLLLDQLEAHHSCADEIREIAAAVQRLCPRFLADDIAAGMRSVIVKRSEESY